MTDVYPPDCGGSGWSTHALALTLIERGHRVRVVTVDPTRSNVGTRRYDAVDVIEVGVRTARRSLRRRLGARDYAYGTIEGFLARQLATVPRPVDIVHAQHLHSGPPAVAAGRRYGCATVVTVRDYWPVCLHGTSWWGGSVCDGCTSHRLEECMHEYWSWPRPAARMMVPWAHRRLRARANGLAAADRVVAVSETVRRRIRDVVSEAGTVVVPNIVDPRQVETGAARGAADAAGGPAGGFLLTAGKLQPTKGFDRLLAMVAAVGSPLPLKVAGDGPCLDALRAQAASTGLRVEFLGWVNHDRLLALQRDAAAVVLPSAWDEPLSRLVLETMGLGTPVVAWAQGGNREIIESDVTGWLVTDAADLRAAWQALSSPARRAEVGREARRHVVERYSPAAVYPAIETAYRAAVGAASRSRRA